MKSRDIDELLTLMLDCVDIYKDRIGNGLCAIVYYMCDDNLINPIERARLNSYLDNYLPLLRYNMTGIDVGVADLNGLYSWPPSDWEIRKKWLEEQIAKL